MPWPCICVIPRLHLPYPPTQSHSWHAAGGALEAGVDLAKHRRRRPVLRRRADDAAGKVLHASRREVSARGAGPPPPALVLMPHGSMRLSRQGSEVQYSTPRDDGCPCRKIKHVKRSRAHNSYGPKSPFIVVLAWDGISDTMDSSHERGMTL